MFRRGDVVGHEHDPGVDALGHQALLRDTEVQPVTGIVTERQHDTGAAVSRLGYPVHLLGRRRREQVTQDRAVGEPGTDYAAVGGVVTGPAPDNQADLAIQRSTRTDEAGRALDPVNVRRVRRRESADDIVLELGRIVVHVGHCSLQAKLR
jgi:hypothetical protein